MIWRRNGDEYPRRGYDDGGLAGLAPVLAAGALNNNKGGCSGGCCDPCNYNMTQHIWDVQRDTARSFADVRKEIQDTAFTQTRDQDRYHYETRIGLDQNRFDTGLGFKDSAILALQNTKELLFAQQEGFRKLEDRMNRTEIDILKEKLAEERMKVPRPSYIPNYGYPHTPVVQNCYADGCNAPGYGYGYGY